MYLGQSTLYAFLSELLPDRGGYFEMKSLTPLTSIGLTCLLLACYNASLTPWEVTYLQTNP
jgi:hypothetical protein